MVRTKGLFVVAYSLCLAMFSTISCGQTPNYQKNVTAAANWTKTSSTLPDGAILYTADQIMPYYSNLGALGLVRTGNPAYYPTVKAWMQCDLPPILSPGIMRLSPGLSFRTWSL